MTRRSMGRWLGIFSGSKLTGVAIARTASAAGIQPVLPLQVGETCDPVAAELLSALTEGRAVPVFYLGGSTPGALRRFVPQSVYRMAPGGPLYAHGYCRLRGEIRTLRLDRTRLG